MPTPTLLVIDDSEDVHALLRVRLKTEGLTLHHASEGVTGLRLARELAPDIILLDVDMPEVSGFEVCRSLKADADTRDIPVVFLTGTASSFVKVEAFDLGAVDYVTKPFDAAELRARVRAALRTKRYLDMLALRAEIDGLTGLFNRAHFDRRLGEMLAAAKRTGGRLGLAMIDIDHFKAINDRHGHPFGDRVIQLVAEIVQGQLRKGDVACRYGGEELAVLLRDATAEGAAIFAERVRKTLAENAPKDPKGQPLKVAASFGVASTDSFATLDDSTEAEMVSAADTALYEAKRGGRDRVCQAARRTPSAA